MAARDYGMLMVMLFIAFVAVFGADSLLSLSFEWWGLALIAVVVAGLAWSVYLLTRRRPMQVAPAAEVERSVVRPAPASAPAASAAPVAAVQAAPAVPEAVVSSAPSDEKALPPLEPQTQVRKPRTGVRKVPTVAKAAVETAAPVTPSRKAPARVATAKRQSSEPVAAADAASSAVRAPSRKAEAAAEPSRTRPRSSEARIEAAAPVEAAAVPPSPVKKPATRRKAAAAVIDTGPDDLKMISGVGPALEKKLNALGITKWSQIAGMGAADIERVEASTGFKGRIERDGWQKQATALAEGGGEEYRRVFGKDPR